MQSYEIKTEAYQGPLDKLLGLVKDKKLDISIISLSEVTNDFLKHVENLQKEGVPHSLIADFVVVASKLLLIKSKTLIPELVLDEEEEEEVFNLELQLKLYNQIKEAEKNIKNGWSPSPRSLTREFLSGQKEFFYPPPESFQVAELLDSMRLVLEEIKKIQPSEKIVNKTLNLQKTIEKIVEKLNNKESHLEFNSLRENGVKREVIVLFLAILHLLREQIVEVEQGERFGNMVIRQRENRG